MARGGNSIIIIKWRDIPAQVNAQMGRERYQVILGAKFQRAIDRAKRKANIYTAEEDVAQWSRETLPLEGDMALAAQSVADRLEEEWTRQRLRRIWPMRVGSKKMLSNSPWQQKILLRSRSLKTMKKKPQIFNSKKETRN